MDLAKDIAAIIAQGADPIRFAAALSREHRVSDDVVAASICAVTARIGVPRVLHPEDVAQARLRADRETARQHRRTEEYLRSEHEED